MENSLPPLPSGFRLDDHVASAPALPPGFTLDAARPAINNSVTQQQKPMGSAYDAVQEPVNEIVTGAVATPIAGLAGIGSTVYQGIKQRSLDAGLRAGADTVNKVQSALTYQPRTKVGEAATPVATSPFRALDSFTGYAGDLVRRGAQAVGASPEVAAGAGTLAKAGATYALPASILKGGARVIGKDIGKATNPSPEQAAQQYVTHNTSLDWSALSHKTQQTLTAIAEDSKNLSALDPKAVERQARLDKLNLPATRGQVTRDLAQLTREENITKSDSGAPLRDISAEQDRILHEHLDTLRNKTGGVAQTRQQLGDSVQNAARSKLDYMERVYQRKYRQARLQGEGLEPADITPLTEWLDNPTNKRNAGYLEQAIKDYTKEAPKNAGTRPIEKIDADIKALDRKAQKIPEDLPFDHPAFKQIEIQYAALKQEMQRALNGDTKPAAAGGPRITINDLEEIRKEAVANALGPPSPSTHYAGQAVGVIDDILNNSGSNIYKDARSAFKATKEEFARQGQLRALTSEKAGLSDRRVALEDTFDQVVLRGSAEQLKTVQESLTKGGTPKTRSTGAQAWRDLQSATIDYLKDKAAGKRAIPGEKQQLQFNSTFLDALYDLDKDGKLDVLFTPEAAAKIRQLAQVTRDVRTKPAGRIAGSDTAPRIIAMLEKVSKLPIAGDLISGVVRAGQKIHEMGRESREAVQATRSPIDEAAVNVKRKRTQRSSLNKLAPYAPVTQERRNALADY